LVQNHWSDVPESENQNHQVIITKQIRRYFVNSYPTDKALFAIPLGEFQKSAQAKYLKTVLLFLFVPEKSAVSIKYTVA
jgi:hypothetical protein